jgi:hypothetical protein
MNTKRKRLVRLAAVYAVTDLAKGKNPVKTAVKLAAAFGKTGACAVKEKGEKTAAATKLAGAAAGVSKWKEPKEVRRRSRRRKLLHLILRKLA